MNGNLIDITDAIFKKGGLLEQEGFPHREGQYQMAMSVATALQNDKVAIAEAGTGTGKTLAYGIPLAIWAMNKGEEKRSNLKRNKGRDQDPADTIPPAGITVHTIALQEQLVKDATLIKSLVKKATGQTPIINRVSGKSNYFCPRTANVVRGSAHTSQQLKDIAGRMLKEHTQRAGSEGYQGMFEELESAKGIRMGDIRAVSGEMNKKAYKESPYNQALWAAKTSDVVILNHALSPFFEVEQLIIDEAHTFRDVYAQNLEYEVNTGNVNRWAEGVTGQAPEGTEDAATVLQRATRNLLTGWAKYAENTGTLKLDKGKPSMIHAQEHIETPPHEEGQPLFDQYNAWNIAVRDLINLVCDTHGHEELAGEDGIKQPAPGSPAMRFLQSIERNVEPVKNAVKWLQGEQAKDARWAEIQHDEENGQPYHIIHRALVDISKELGQFHERPSGKSELALKTVCLTSATLSGVGGVNDFRKEHGIPEEQALMSVCPTPFDLESQMEIRVAINMPMPGRQEREFQQALPLAVLDAVKHTETLPFEKRAGGTLVLFTSIESMENCRKKLSKENIPLRHQERGVSKSELVGWMKNTPGAVLLGVESMWTGIDLPGDALKHVVITRLPFKPGTPKEEKQRKIVQERGGNGFMEVDVNNALRPFNQGKGRLLRKITDSGTVSVLDPRIKTAGYGMEFLKGMPFATEYNVRGIAEKEIKEEIIYGGL